MRIRTYSQILNVFASPTGPDVEYDYIMPTVNTAIPTKLNAAYVSTRMSQTTTIPTDQNAAYGAL